MQKYLILLIIPFIFYTQPVLAGGSKSDSTISHAALNIPLKGIMSKMRYFCIMSNSTRKCCLKIQVSIFLWFYAYIIVMSCRT